MIQEYEEKIALLENELYERKKEIIWLKNQIVNIDKNRLSSIEENRLQWRGKNDR